MKPTGLLLGVCLLLTACEPAASPTPPEAFVAAISTTVTQHQPLALWEALPEGYRNDVHGLVQELAGKMDARVWERGFALLDKLARALAEKKELILGSALHDHPLFQELGAEEIWDDIVELLTAVSRSEARTLDGFRSLQIPEFLNGPGVRITRVAATAAQRLLGEQYQQAVGGLARSQTRVLRAEPERMLLRIESPGLAPQEEFFIRIENRWIMQSFAGSWREVMASARRGLAEFTLDAARLRSLGELLDKVDTQLDALLAASSSDEAGQALRKVLATVETSFRSG